MSSEQEKQEIKQIVETLRKHSENQELSPEIREAYSVTLDSFQAELQSNKGYQQQSFEEIKTNAKELLNFAYEFAVAQTKGNTKFHEIIPKIQDSFESFFSLEPTTYQTLTPVLPSTQTTTELSPMNLHHKLAVFSGVTGVVVGAIIALLTSASLFFGILWGFSFVTIAYAFSIIFNTIRRGYQFEKKQKQKIQELSPTYCRYRVSSQAQQGKIILQLEEYSPGHQSQDSQPFYYAQVIKHITFEPEQEIELYEALAELQLEAERKEEQALRGYLRDQEAINIQDNLQKFLSL